MCKTKTDQLPIKYDNYCTTKAFYLVCRCVKKKYCSEDLKKLILNLGLFLRYS